MTSIVDSARHVCRAYFTGSQLGQVMSNLADDLATIDERAFNASRSTARRRNGRSTAGDGIGYTIAQDGKTT